MRHWRAAFATTVVLIAGVSAVSLGTDGWTSWTAESARRIAIQRSPVALPDAQLIDETGRPALLTDVGQPIVLMEFIYTRCPTLCQAMGAEFRALQNDLVAANLDDHVRLVSVSFDPDNDGPTELADYLARFGANAALWSAYTIKDTKTLDRLLHDLGVIVIADQKGGFVHNAAIYFVNDNKVVRVFDFSDRVAILEAVQWQLQTS